MVLGDNQKRNRNYKFIVEDNGKDIHTLFGKELETDMLDMLQHKRYMINEKAFDYAEVISRSMNHPGRIDDRA